MNPATIAVVVLSLALAPSPPPLTPAQQVASLDWLAGRWQGDTWDGTYSSPEGGVVLAFSKEYREDGQAGFFEYERILVVDGRVVLIPSPFGRESVPFPLVELDVSARRARFENPDHDFPRSITYQRTSALTLVFTLEGEEDGHPVSTTVRLRRRLRP